MRLLRIGRLCRLPAIVLAADRLAIKFAGNHPPHLPLLTPCWRSTDVLLVASRIVYSRRSFNKSRIVRWIKVV
jgi:hypothetical protein